MAHLDAPILLFAAGLFDRAQDRYFKISIDKGPSLVVRPTAFSSASTIYLPTGAEICRLVFWSQFEVKVNLSPLAIVFEKNDCANTRPSDHRQTGDPFDVLIMKSCVLALENCTFVSLPFVFLITNVSGTISSLLNCCFGVDRVTRRSPSCSVATSGAGEDGEGGRLSTSRRQAAWLSGRNSISIAANQYVTPFGKPVQPFCL